MRSVFKVIGGVILFIVIVIVLMAIIAGISSGTVSLTITGVIALIILLWLAYLFHKTSSTKCSRCAKMHLNHHKYCSECGYELSKKTSSQEKLFIPNPSMAAPTLPGTSVLHRCPRCQSEISFPASFCGGCGMNLAQLNTSTFQTNR